MITKLFGRIVDVCFIFWNLTTLSPTPPKSHINPNNNGCRWHPSKNRQAHGRMGRCVWSTSDTTELPREGGDDHRNLHHQRLGNSLTANWWWRKNPVNSPVDMGVSLNGGTPKSSMFNRIFHYKPSILGYPYFWKHLFGKYSIIRVTHTCQVVFFGDVFHQQVVWRPTKHTKVKRRKFKGFPILYLDLWCFGDFLWIVPW